MLAAFLTTLLFSISGVSASRSTRILPSLEANFWRLLLATLFLATYGHGWGAGLGGVALGWFLISGFIGFGVGDIALYLAYPRLGSRLVILIVHCVAAPLAAGVEWICLGLPMTGTEVVASGLILSGVVTALFPERGLEREAKARSGFGAGVGYALVAAAGQGLGAVLSRHAFEVARMAGEPVDGISAAYQRILPGVALSALTYIWLRRWGRGGVPGDAGASGRLRKAAPWVLVNALAGPTLGVSCFQWALAQRGTGVVLPIVALTPLIIIPFAMRWEGERPSRRSLFGGVLAVAGAVIHAATHS
ncbi:MAG: EamA family transporter [Verrucomicrobiae bacterium]|nr:EamA family transporter [Verrucomicrobiae bacterium]